MTTKNETSKLNLEDFAYDLPPELVAQKPCAIREQSRLMLVDRKSRSCQHKLFHDIANIFAPGDVIVANDTKVLPARLIAKRQSGGLIKLLLLKPEAGKPNLWQALVTPIKRLKMGEILYVTAQHSTNVYHIRIEDIVEGIDGHKRLVVNLGDPSKVSSLLNEVGIAPLPPYIKRDYDDELVQKKRLDDLDRYQTVFAKVPGAVAAPTAGLHFSETLIKCLQERGVHFCYVTLHVGPGTFKPITTSIEDHKVEAEIYSIPAVTADLVQQAKSNYKRIIAVGTTSLRALESAAADNDSQAKSLNGTSIRSVDNAITSLYIYPGYRFKLVDAIITNFHLSKSSLLVLVSAFAGHELTMRSYKEAIDQRYRFFSYGDAMLIL